VIKASGSKFVLSLVKSVIIKNLSRLLGQSLLEMVIVDCNARHMTLVAWDHTRFLSSRDLG